MRAFLILLPAVLLAQTPAPKAAAPAAPKPATAAAPKPAAPAAPKPATAARPAAAIQPMTDEEKTIYALGLSVSKSLGQFDLSPAELEIIKRAMTDAAAKKPAVELDTWGPKIQGLAEARGTRVAGREKATSAAYLTKAA